MAYKIPSRDLLVRLWHYCLDSANLNIRLKNAGEIEDTPELKKEIEQAGDDFGTVRNLLDKHYPNWRFPNSKDVADV